MKKSMIVGAASLLVVGVSQAAVVVSWESEGLPTSTGSNLSLEGTLEYAYNFGSTVTAAVNGVTFIGTDSGAVTSAGASGDVTFVNADNGTTAGKFDPVGGDMGAVLTSARWAPRTVAGETVQLNNLTDGQEYLVQLYCADTSKTFNIGLDMGTANQYITANTVAAGVHITGTFTADATETAEFTIAHSIVSGNANMNILQVRAIPEPATFGLVAGFGGVALFIRRRFMM